MNVTSVNENDVLVVEVQCEFIDAMNSGDFKKEVMALLSPAQNTVFDLKELGFLDSSGLGVLLSCMRRVRAGGKKLVLCNLQSKVRSIVNLVHLERVIAIVETREEALASFESS